MARKLIQKLRSRSWREIRFRIGQEVTNLCLRSYPPRLPASVLRQIQSSRVGLPDAVKIAGRFRSSNFAQNCLAIAEEILHHRIPLLGTVLDTGPEIRWRRDYSSGIETPALYFRRIPYLDAARAGDHKNIWELSRHQHLVLLAQAYLFSGRQEFLDEVVRELDSWMAENPFQRGINWASALEVAFRALSWIWIYHLAGDRFTAPFRERFLQELYRHGLHLETNLSYYFSPNTHLLGEAVALHALGRLFPQFPPASRWESTGAAVVRNELDRQVFADGCHFELSLYYHVYALDMFLFHAILRGLDHAFRDKLTRMAVLLDTMMGPPDVLPIIGDDDGGRFFHPFGRRDRFGLATLATCGVFLDHPEWIRDPHCLEEQAAWWLGPEALEVPPQPRPEPRSTRFAESGLFTMTAGNIQLIVDAGPFGPGNAGHTHADTLSIVLRRSEEQILIDPGTFTYVGDPVWRNRFRGTAAHSTIRIDGLDQGTAGNPFVWSTRPDTRVLCWETSPAKDVLAARCSYAGFQHERTIEFDKKDLRILVLDRLAGPPAGEHRIEQFWHFGAGVRPCSPGTLRIGTHAVITFDAQCAPRLFEGEEYGWISPAFGVKFPASAAVVDCRRTFPATLSTIIDFSSNPRP